MKLIFRLASPWVLSFCLTISFCAAAPSAKFVVTPDASAQTFHVAMQLAGLTGDTLKLKMPAWTPGYYQMLYFADKVSEFKPMNAEARPLTFVKLGRSVWSVAILGSTNITIFYDVKAVRPFVATPFVDGNRAYISPAGVFMHISGNLNVPSEVELRIPEGWTIATGLTPVKGKANQFTAPDFDILYDSPLLAGALEELPAFVVNGVPHRFIGFKPGEFDRRLFMDNLKKVVTESVGVIGDIPYSQYTFIAIGPGQGGIEHLNSTTFGFAGESMKTPAGNSRMYKFLAHEYFHHFNVKRIRPVELGPFDYNKENRTNMLWVSEGFTVYYDELVTRRAGVITVDEFFKGISQRIAGYENTPGHLYQTAVDASANTWSDGPFGRTDDEMNKTISVYEKGAILGALLDLKIRDASKGQKSLDDVMKFLYNDFYKKKKRGFTENEFRQVCEQIAGTALSEFFDYTSTLKPLDYKKYFGYAGLNIDTSPKQVPGAWLGISTRTRNDSLLVTAVEYESPAWNKGIRRGMVIVEIDGKKTEGLSGPMITDHNSGEQVKLSVVFKGNRNEFTVPLTTKFVPDFTLSPVENPTPLQQGILKKWSADGSKK